MYISKIHDSEKESAEPFTQMLELYEKKASFKKKELKNCVFFVNDTDTVLPIVVNKMNENDYPNTMKQMILSISKHESRFKFINQKYKKKR